MFEHVTDGMPLVGAEDLYLGGASVVIGVADEDGNLVGYFGREYHPNRRAPIDQIGAEEPPIGRPRLAIGLALGDDETVIGWFGSSFVKSVGKAVSGAVKTAVTVTTAPARAAVDIARGKNVAKTLARTMVTQPAKMTVASGKAALAPAGQIVKAAAPIIKSPVTKALVGGLAIAFPAVGLPAAAALATATTGLAYAETYGGKIQAGLNLAGKLTGSGGGSVSTSAGTAAVRSGVMAPRPAPGPSRAVGQSQAKLVAEAARARQKAAQDKAAADRAKAIAAAQAKAGAAAGAAAAAAGAAAARAQAEAAKKKSVLALATADKVLAAAKGTLPAQKAAPLPVAKALQTAAKKTIAATYAASKMGDEDAKRGVAAIAIANRVQKIVPATRANIHPVVAPVAGTTYQAIHVAKNGTRTRGSYKATGTASGSGNAAGVIVLRDGTPIEGTFAKVG